MVLPYASIFTYSTSNRSLVSASPAISGAKFWPGRWADRKAGRAFLVHIPAWLFSKERCETFRPRCRCSTWASVVGDNFNEFRIPPIYGKTRGFIALSKFLRRVVLSQSPDEL